VTHFLRGHNVSAHLTGFPLGSSSAVTTISARTSTSVGWAEAADEMDTLVITFTGSPVR